MNMKLHDDLCALTSKSIFLPVVDKPLLGKILHQLSDRVAGGVAEVGNITEDGFILFDVRRSGFDPTRDPET